MPWQHPPSGPNLVGHQPQCQEGAWGQGPAGSSRGPALRSLELTGLLDGSNSRIKYSPATHSYNITWNKHLAGKSSINFKLRPDVVAFIICRHTFSKTKPRTHRGICVKPGGSARAEWWASAVWWSRWTEGRWMSHAAHRWMTLSARCRCSRLTASSGGSDDWAAGPETAASGGNWNRR